MKNCLRTLLLLLCSTVAFAGNSAPADGTYTLTYVVDGETYQTATLAAGAAINLPAGPAKEGYEFVKWDLETAVPIDIASNADAMLYTNAPCTDTRYGDQFTSWQVLFDGNAGTFFHSEYANNESADGLDHYLRVDMGEGKSITSFTFTYTNRNTNSYINAPKTMVVEGSNEADGEYVELATLTNLSSTNSDVYNSQVIGNGTAYRYIRYRVTETHYNQKVYEHPFFFIAEFGMADAAIPTTMPASDISLVAVYKEPSGTCGENATWSLANGVLTISGTGDMANYSDTGDNTAPWTEYREDITTVIIEDGVTGIGDYSFGDCYDLTSVTIGNSVTSIGDYVFGYCYDLTNVTIGSGVTSIGDYMFSYCSNLTSIVVDEANSKFDSREGCNAIIETATNTLTAGCKNTTIPGSVTSIGERAFYHCTGLTSITIPNSVTSIGNHAFTGCYSLTSITIPNSVTSIQDSAFEYCQSLTSIEIPNSVTSIGHSAFLGCYSLTSIEIPNSVTSIGDYAFGDCYDLTSVTIGNSVTSIGQRAFLGCKSLTSVTIPNSVTSIGSYAFQECTGLTNVTIPNSVTSIQDSAFFGCDNLTSIVVDEENSVYDSREGCNAIIETATNTLIAGCKNTTIPGSVTSIGYCAFNGCRNLTSVTIPNSVTSIGYRAFAGCSGLTSITIPNSVTIIEDSAFEGCTGLTSIEIPNSVTSVGMWAFQECNALTDIYFASNPTIGDDEILSTTTCHLTLTDSDAADFNTANANTYADVSYTRTISEGKYGTIMLPFAPDEASLQNYAFYTLKEAGDGYIRFEEVAAPVANTPYLYTLRAGGENVAITGGETTIAADINNCNVNGWDLVGSFTNQTIDCTDGNYYAYSAARNEINRITKTLTVSPYRAYLKSTAAQNSNLRVFIGGTTGVTEISPDDIEGFDGGAVYDLYGRPVNEPAKGGVYIIDGKKVVW